MALPIINTWKNYFDDYHEGMGSSYERIIINNLLLRLKKLYHLNSVVEVPIFGFTGLTGLNSIALNSNGCSLTLVDDNTERINQVSQVLEELNKDINLIEVKDYAHLPFENNSFDMGWNFSALWFVGDLSDFLNELTRITKKIVLICVPNQDGLGYKWQKANTDIPHGFVFDESNIDPGRIKVIMKNLNWRYVAEDYFDCPLWPDIGMSKEKFLGKYLSSLKISKSEIPPKKVVSIIDYYKGNDAAFPERMMKLSFLEKYAPNIFKRYWSHHKWILFENKST